jgi:hypothetical protein
LEDLSLGFVDGQAKAGRTGYWHQGQVFQEASVFSAGNKKLELIESLYSTFVYIAARPLYGSDML